VTSQVSHPYKSTDFTQILNILILVSFHNNLDSHTLLNLQNDPLAFRILALTSLLVPPFSATILPKLQKYDDYVINALPIFLQLGRLHFSSCRVLHVPPIAPSSSLSLCNNDTYRYGMGGFFLRYNDVLSHWKDPVTRLHKACDWAVMAIHLVFIISFTKNTFLSKNANFKN